MADIVFLTIIVVFFALGVLYVRACDGIVRSGYAEEIVAVRRDDDHSQPEDEQ